MVGRINFCKTILNALIPTRSTEDSVGYDLFTPYEVSINPEEKQKEIDIGIAMEMNGKYFGYIRSKSRLAKNNPDLFLKAGVVDPGYRGSIKVLLHNKGQTTITFNAGDAIAQLLFIPVYLPELIEVSKIDDETQRGTRGFGQVYYDSIQK
ncbi:Deoxyuridine 5'-triphosphate nucleotidohydrolase [Araneus ventricosus]|uniref:Deoxyuridine 5'-triphosphate nucleotidohydrolase n=1 Tax=Araneus ventricosus TaxID=182803 RepID=A0A4Y2JPF2_ARAVE|nr:Deoxyuridine 5'-triphosphate nucleotidohydrolase [Araneus ventricosus]